MLHFVFCRKNFCGYARVDVDSNYTTYENHEEHDRSHNKGLLAQIRSLIGSPYIVC